MYHLSPRKISWKKGLPGGVRIRRTLSIHYDRLEGLLRWRQTTQILLVVLRWRFSLCQILDCLCPFFYILSFLMTKVVSCIFSLKSQAGRGRYFCGMEGLNFDRNCRDRKLLEVWFLGCRKFPSKFRKHFFF